MCSIAIITLRPNPFCPCVFCINHKSNSVIETVPQTQIDSDSEADMEPESKKRKTDGDDNPLKKSLSDLQQHKDQENEDNWKERHQQHEQLLHEVTKQQDERSQKHTQQEDESLENACKSCFMEKRRTLRDVLLPPIEEQHKESPDAERGQKEMQVADACEATQAFLRERWNREMRALSSTHVARGVVPNQATKK